MTTGDISDLAAAVRSGEVSAVALVDEALARIDRDDKAINAVVARCDERAHQEARRIDDGVRAGDDPGPLAGVPVLVKDLEDVKGMPTTQGSKLFADSPSATQHSTVPKRLTDAGASIVGKRSEEHTSELQSHSE